MNKLVIFINNEIVFEFDRVVTLEAEQSSFLDKMDRDLDKGIKIRGDLLQNPDKQKRTTFIAMNLIKAIQQGNDAAIFASCAYLVNRNPKLIEVHANDHDDTVKIELINE